MRILLYVYEWPPIGGGVANAASELLGQFAQIDNLEIDVVTTSVDGKYSKDTEFCVPTGKITIYHLPLGDRRQRLHSQKITDMFTYTIASYLFTWKQLFSGQDYDLTHSFGYPNGLVSFLFIWKWPYIVSLRGVDVPGYNQRFGLWYVLYRWLVKIVWSCASCVTVNSLWLRDLARKTTSSIAYVVVRNGVDTSLFKASSKAETYKKFTVTAGATVMGKKKGLDSLLDGFAKFYNKHPDSQILLIGSGDEESSLKKQAKDLKVDEAVRFVGRKEKSWLAKQLPRCHVLCLPSKAEGMSNAILEAMACGLPIITTEPSKELIDGNGLLLETPSPTSISLALDTIYSSPSKRKRMGIKSRQLAEKMSWNFVAKKYYQLYLDLVS